ncbi:MAG: hypothetical protein ACYDAE_28865 [Steroidobacteraceae bacterium]
MQARWRHVGNTQIDLANPSPLLSGPFGAPIQWTGTRDYLDLIASDQIFGSVFLQLGVNKVLDKDPQRAVRLAAFFQKPLQQHVSNGSARETRSEISWRRHAAAHRMGGRAASAGARHGRNR